MAQTEEVGYRLSDEVDENGRQFVLNSKGNVEFGRVDSASGLTEAPILLSEGVITNAKTGDGYGLVHIEERHGKEIRKAGYKSVLEFVEHVAQNYHLIIEGKDRNGNQTYRLILQDAHNNTLMVELSGDGAYWNINTAGIFKHSYGANKPVVYSRHTTTNQPAETGGASLSEAQSGTTSSTSMNAPTHDGEKPVSETINESSSNGKDTKISETDKEKVASDIASAESKVDIEPTDGQKKAGNYKKGYLRLDGYDITIEQPKGSIRSGVDGDGKAWSQEMRNTYGYIRGTEGVDGDHIDVFLDDGPTQGNVFVVDQVDPKTGEFDEHKVMYGFADAETAKAAYLSNYEDGWKGLGAITEVSKDEFKKWIESSRRKTKPFGEYKSAGEIGNVPEGETSGTGASDVKGLKEERKKTGAELTALMGRHQAELDLGIENKETEKALNDASNKLAGINKQLSELGDIDDVKESIDSIKRKASGKKEQYQQQEEGNKVTESALFYRTKDGKAVQYTLYHGQTERPETDRRDTSGGLRNAVPGGAEGTSRGDSGVDMGSLAEGLAAEQRGDTGRSQRAEQEAVGHK